MSHVIFSTGTGDINPTWWSKSCGSRSSREKTLDRHYWTWDEASCSTAIWTVVGMTSSLPLIPVKQAVLSGFPVGAACGTWPSWGHTWAVAVTVHCASEMHPCGGLWVLSAVIQVHVLFSIIALWSLIIIVLLILLIKWVFEPSKGSSASLMQSQPC